MRVQMPPGERKSGMPDSVEIPAPVNTTVRRAARRSAASSRVSASVVKLSRAGYFALQSADSHFASKLVFVAT